MRHEPSFLKDILSACRKIETIVATTDEGSFLKDEVLPAAVLHHLTVIGDVPFVCRLERSPSGSTMATNYCRAAQPSADFTAESTLRDYTRRLNALALAISPALSTGRRLHWPDGANASQHSMARRLHLMPRSLVAFLSS